MYPFAEPEPPLRQMAVAIRMNAGPLALAAVFLLLARISQIATYDPAVKGLTLAAIAEVALLIAAFGLATLTGCWAVLTGGRPGGLRGLAEYPAERRLPFAAYTIVFVLWFLMIAAILTRIAETLLGGDSGLGVAAATGVITAAVLILMYIQIGFLFPDIARTGQTSIVFAMALGLSSGRRIILALIAPVGILILPATVLENLIFDPPGMIRAAAAFPGILDLVAAVLLAGLTAMGWAACAVAMTRVYQDLIPNLQAENWR